MFRDSSNTDQSLSTGRDRWARFNDVARCVSQNMADKVVVKLPEAASLCQLEDTAHSGPVE